MLGIISISSCKKDSNIGNSNENKLSDAVVIENGYLKFRDQKAFDSLLNILAKPENFNSKPKELRNFKSYKDIYIEIAKKYENVNTDKSFEDFKDRYSDIVEIKSDSSLTYKFGTPLSALFTNANGEVMIGDFVTVYTKDHRMISYNGKHKSELEVATISKSDQSQGVFVSNISKRFALVSGSQALSAASASTRSLRSAVYYNEDGKRRLSVDIWIDETPRANPDWTPLPSISRYYCTSTQELKKTFGGWRTNETDYYFNNLNYNWVVRGGSTRSFNLVYHSVQGAYGPIIIDLATISEDIIGFSGSGHFTSGGVPNTPVF